MGILHTPIRVGGMVVRNRLYRAPVLEGAGSGPDAAEVYARQFVANARAGVGLIIQGSSCVSEEGRTSPGMSVVASREQVLGLAPMVDEVHRAGAQIVLQLGHGGIFAMEAWHEPYASSRQGPLLAASPVPWFLRPSFAGVPVHVMTTPEVRDLARRFGMGRRLGAPRRLRRRPARLGQRQALGPVPVPFLQAPHRRLRRLAA
jgi:2,4-dienoyl-CoA reductase-like NADH-dependent reductase (Old Yellow Enzyme family)